MTQQKLVLKYSNTRLSMVEGGPNELLQNQLKQNQTAIEQLSQSY